MQHRTRQGILDVLKPAEFTFQDTCENQAGIMEARAHKRKQAIGDMSFVRADLMQPYRSLHALKI